MGFNSRYPSRMVPSWAATVGACRRNGVRVKVYCARCGLWRTARLRAIEAAKGPDFSLFNRRMPCPTPDCPGPAKFSYSPARGTPFRPMAS